MSIQVMKCARRPAANFQQIRRLQTTGYTGYFTRISAREEKTDTPKQTMEQAVATRMSSPKRIPQSPVGVVA